MFTVDTLPSLRITSLIISYVFIALINRGWCFEYSRALVEFLFPSQWFPSYYAMKCNRDDVVAFVLTETPSHWSRAWKVKNTDTKFALSQSCCISGLFWTTIQYFSLAVLGGGSQCSLATIVQLESLCRQLRCGQN